MKNVNVIKFMMLLLGFSLVLYEGQAMTQPIKSESKAPDSKCSVGTSQVCRQCLSKNIPLIWAVEQGHIDCVRALIASGDVNIKLYLGEHAVYYDHLDVVRVLITAQADVNSRDDSDKTPLHWAAYHGRTQHVQMLIEARAQVNLKNKFGVTPILYAAQRAWQTDDLGLHACKNCIKLLLHAGAEPKLGPAILRDGKVAEEPKPIIERAKEQAIVDKCVIELQVGITKKQQNVITNIKTVPALEYFPPGVLSIIASFEGLEIAEIVNDAAPTEARWVDPYPASSHYSDDDFDDF